jgi:hypothetical protein
MRKNSKLNPGIAAMRNMYDARNVDAFRSELLQSSFVRNVIHIARLFTIASCSVVKYISAEYPTVTMYGNMLIGLYVGKALLWGLGTYVEYNSGKPVLDIVNALRGDEGDRISMATMNACICDIREDVVASIARAVTSLIRSGDRVEIAREDFDKISRLDTLIQKLDSGRSIGKWGLCAARSASLLAGVTAGVVTSFQDLGPSAFWMKLSSNAMDAITDSVDMFRAGEVVDKYVTISEIMYLCEYFLSQETYEL